MDRTRAFLALYASTVFEHAPFPAGWPRAFWILNAWPPTGETASAAENARNDEALRAALAVRSRRAPHRVTGGSPDGTHREPGWAADVGRATALDLGRAFRQVAVFRVEDGRLSVVDCGTGRVHALGRGMAG